LLQTEKKKSVANREKAEAEAGKIKNILHAKGNDDQYC